MLLLAFVGLTACGGGSSSFGTQGGGGGPTSAPKKAAPPAAVEPTDDWSALEPYFNQFVDQSITDFKDPFKLQIVKHVGKKDLLDRLSAMRPLESDDEESRGPEVPKGPLQRFGIQGYRPIIIMTGLAEPKAVLEAPSGQTFVVTRDTYVGSEGGFVEDLTQYHVVFRVPGMENLLVMSLKPELMQHLKKDLGEALQLQPGL